MSKYGVDYRTKTGKGIVRADGFQSGNVLIPKIVASGTITINPPSLSTGAFGEGDLDLVGVALGDKVDLYAPYDTQGINYQASPQAADKITVSWTSCSTSTVDLASGEWGYTVTRRV